MRFLSEEYVMRVLKIFKSLLSRIFILVLMGSLGACSEECGYDSHAGYQLGKQNFDYLEGNMASILSFWDLALRMNTYLSALDEEGVDRVEELFPEYRLLQVNEHEWVGLKEQDTVFRIVTDDLALTTETARWEIVGYRAPYEGQITVLCSSLRTWMFTVSALQNRRWISDASLKINYNGEKMPRNFNDGDWIVSGVGKSIADGEEILNFEIAESLIRYAESHYLFDKGLLYLRLKSMFSRKEEIVKAEMKTLPGSDRSLQITYRGEVYSY